mmetsp:Transcript_83894/g.201231  ORF Transcript_83894/g.201231 Transcript_83894/m.201231 type:complete len:223 (-) Transcript_83894:902-1570(-)
MAIPCPPALQHVFDRWKLARLCHSLQRLQGLIPYRGVLVPCGPAGGRQDALIPWACELRCALQRHARVLCGHPAVQLRHGAPQLRRRLLRLREQASRVEPDRHKVRVLRSGATCAIGVEEGIAQASGHCVGRKLELLTDSRGLSGQVVHHTEVGAMHRGGADGFEVPAVRHPLGHVQVAATMRLRNVHHIPRKQSGHGIRGRSLAWPLLLQHGLQQGCAQAL